MPRTKQTFRGPKAAVGPPPAPITKKAKAAAAKDAMAVASARMVLDINTELSAVSRFYNGLPKNLLDEELDLIIETKFSGTDRTNARKVFVKPSEWPALDMLYEHPLVGFQPSSLVFIFESDNDDNVDADADESSSSSSSSTSPPKRGTRRYKSVELEFVETIVGRVNVKLRRQNAHLPQAEKATLFADGPSAAGERGEALALYEKQRNCKCIPFGRESYYMWNLLNINTGDNFTFDMRRAIDNLLATRYPDTARLGERSNTYKFFAKVMDRLDLALASLCCLECFKEISEPVSRDSIDVMVAKYRGMLTSWEADPTEELVILHERRPAVVGAC